jgi:organic hydroperoxide reductase OsmC/OhrA
MANAREHRYAVSLIWNGNLGSGTSGYPDYSRNYEIGADGKPVIHGSADPAFRGDRSRWNPEELLVASLSACHKLWYLHLAAEAGIVVTAYADRAEGVMEVGRDGVGRFKKRDAAPHRNRDGGQRYRPRTNSPQTRAREVLHCQFSELPC